MSFLRQSCLAAMVTVMTASLAQAHFIWIVTKPAEKPEKLEVYFGEAAIPDDPELLGNIEGIEAWGFGGRRAEPRQLKLEKGDDAYVATIPENLQSSPIVAKFNYGRIARGDAAFVLKYYAKTYPSVVPASWKAVENEEILPLEVTPELQEGELVFTVRWKGERVSGSQVTAYGPKMDQVQGETDENGTYRVTPGAAGLYEVRARMIENQSGEVDGKPYSDIRHYSTLTFHYSPEQLKSVQHDWPAMEKGTTSFGAAVVGDHLYVYGGHYGQAHHYSQEGQSGDFQRLNLTGGDWETLPGGPKLTGLGMMPYNGKLYRVGGFTAKNTDDEDESLWSQDSFARFDPETKEWETLPSLPEGRSSHDVAIVGDTLYVVGGWKLQGDEETEWHDTALAVDLSADQLEWKEIPQPPFHRRALSLAEWNDKLYVIGGMQQEGGITQETAVYDPATQSWSEGPALLGTGMDGFGTAAFSCNGHLFVSTMSGSVLRLSNDGSAWEYVGRLENPRFFHRQVPWNGELVFVGGADMAVGKLEGLERMPIQQPDAQSDSTASLK